MGKEDAWLKEILDGLGNLGPPWKALLAKIKDWPLFVGYTISAEKFRLETAVGDEFTKQELRQRGIRLHESLFREMEKKGIIRTVRKKRVFGAGGKGRTRNVYQRLV
jgi:hypothetical protein